MVLRADSIRERLLKLEEAASGLERIVAGRTTAPDLRDDWAIERGLQLGAEAVLDLNLDRARVGSFAEHAPADFRAFSAAIRAWLATLPETPPSSR